MLVLAESIELEPRSWHIVERYPAKNQRRPRTPFKTMDYELQPYKTVFLAEVVLGF